MRATVTTHAVLDVGDPLFAVLGNNPGLLMLMAAIAGILLVIATKMASRARCIVIAVQHKVAVVIEGCRLPVCRLMTCRAGQRLAAVKIISRRHMT